MKIKLGLASLILLSSVVSTLSLFSPVSAAPIDTKTPEEQAKIYNYYYAVAGCARNVNFEDGSLDDEITADNLNRYDWFDRNGSSSIQFDVGLGAMFTTDGKAVCNQTDWFGDAIKSFGYTSATEAFCDLFKYAGAGREGSGNCLDGDGSFDAANDNDERSNSARQAIEEKVYGARGEPQLSGAARYFLYYQSFTKGCVASPVTSATGDKSYTDIKVVQSDGTIKSTIFQGQGKPGREDSVTVQQALPDGYFTQTCTQLAQGISDASQAYADYVKTSPNAQLPGGGVIGGSGSSPSSSCQIQAIGWLVCPVVTFLADIADKTYSLISDWFLTLDTALYTDGSGTQVAWKYMRDLANILFVIFFIVIIYSQITGAGVSNYGIKRMLPRLIIGAILVNSSFIICQVAADLSNILGSSIVELFKSVTSGMPGQTGGNALDGSGGTGFLDITVLVLAGGAAILATLAFGMPLIIMAVVVFALILLLLVVRKMLLILLIVISPIAFVCFLLPNTEDYFKKWRQAFVRLLMIYPIIAFCFGAGILARAIINTSSSKPAVSSIVTKSEK